MTRDLHICSVWVCLATAGLAACHAAPVAGNGVAQQRMISRVYNAPLPELRERVLARFASPRPALPDPFGRMTATELKPPPRASDWLEGFVDPGGFLSDYKQLPPAARANDLLLESSDDYWLSEYEVRGRPVRFRCGFLLHFTERSPNRVEVAVYEIVPTVWVGERWALSRHGVGFGRQRDLRFAEPTVKDRIAVLDLLETLQ